MTLVFTETSGVRLKGAGRSAAASWNERDASASQVCGSAICKVRLMTVASQLWGRTQICVSQQQLG